MVKQAGVSDITYKTIIFLVCVCLAAEEGKCPDDHGKQAETCMSKSGLAPLGGSLHKFITDPKEAKELCDSGKFQRAVECLDKIYTACASQDQAMQELSLTVNPDGWRKAAKKLCDNVNVLESNSVCITKDVEETNMCVDAKVAAFGGEKQSKILTTGQALNAQTLMGIACTYANQILGCVKKPMTKNCPSNVSRLVTDVLQLLLPPACQPPTMPKTAGKDQGYQTVTVKGDNSAMTMKSFTIYSIFTLISLHFVL
ncbi:hypothetical protein LOTGIDRAFT_238379 [Lottia gigantea]|uniref:Uncharacterized protein n=1 Tax=Lottia gigantea TaxID=225164 RepID=V4B4Z2_LOTGI|nr:hypothetical protein LOTGIDRAFT_238379 [Lottia gigantea]ESP01022.1 hypothetical protein LOTGIDRAFT_238379 [Lottia gigantea]